MKEIPSGLEDAEHLEQMQDMQKAWEFGFYRCNVVSLCPIRQQPVLWSIQNPASVRHKITARASKIGDICRPSFTT